MNKITVITRKAIFNAMEEKQLLCCAEKDELQFFNELFDLKKLPSHDHRSQYPTMYEDLWQHRINNPGDWPEYWWASDTRIALNNCQDKKFLEFLCKTVDPLFKDNISEVKKLIGLYNKFLMSDGFRISEKEKISGKPNFYPTEFNFSESQPIAFISHDSRDKEKVARVIANALEERGIPIWFDEYTLKPGDRLIESIDRGIKKCRKCILVLSPNFLSNSGWTKIEFDTIIIKELHERRNAIIPIWLDVTSKDVYEYNGNLANILAINWDQGAEIVCDKLEDVIFG